MTRPAARSVFSRAAAFLAVALLAFAGVKSTVMQAQMAQAQAQAQGLCGPGFGQMAAMDMGTAHHDPSQAAAHRACAFCSAAAHAPLLSLAATFRVPAAVAFSLAVITASLGPRGPPSFRPTATGPPTFLTT